MKNITASIINGSRESGQIIAQANIPFLILQEHAVFTHLEESSLNPYSDTVDSKKFYQRRINPERVKSIVGYIEDALQKEMEGKEFAALFPTAMLLAATTDIDKDNINTDDGTIIIPSDIDFYVVDGQHRLQSMETLYERISQPKLFESDLEKYIRKYLENYKFNCMILLNFDMWEQARVFADVNFNQKPVDRSLYYSIYGMHYSDVRSDHKQSYMYVAHQLVAHLNSAAYSPLRGMIKMLGNGEGFVSQAFLADALIRHIKSPRGIWYEQYARQKDLRDAPGRYRFMVQETVSFFNVTKELFAAQWPTGQKHRSIILKTTGIGALVRLMGYIHTILDPETIESLNEPTDDGVAKKYEDELREKLSPLMQQGEILFGFQGEFAGTGGGGLETRLFKRMKQIINGEVCKELVDREEREVNGKKVGVKIYKNEDGFYTFELSHYFQNDYQMAPYRPGSGAISDSMKSLLFKLDMYFEQIEPNAKAFKNTDF